VIKQRVHSTPYTIRFQPRCAAAGSNRLLSLLSNYKVTPGGFFVIILHTHYIVTWRGFQEPVELRFSLVLGSAPLGIQGQPSGFRSLFAFWRFPDRPCQEANRESHVHLEGKTLESHLHGILYIYMDNKKS